MAITSRSARRLFGYTEAEIAGPSRNADVTSTLTRAPTVTTALLPDIVIEPSSHTSPK